MNKLDSLTGVRGILAAMVVLVHGLRLTGNLEGSSLWADGLRLFGKFGVTGFFILSGFILSHVYRDKDWKIRDFAINRIARIYPVYLIGIAFAFPLDWFSPNFNTNNREVAFALSLPALQSWFSFSNGRFNSPGWTISVEFFFYAIFPILHLIRSRSEKHFLVIMALVTVASACLWNPNQFLTSDRFPALRLWEFMLGMFIEPYLKKCRCNLKYGSLVSVGLVLLGPFVGAYVGMVTTWDFAKWISMGLISLVVICILGMGDLNLSSGRFLATKLWIIGGEISYSLYLIHYPVQRYGRAAIEFLTGNSLQSLSWQSKCSFLAATTLLSLIASYALWRIVEMPCRNFLRSRFAAKGKSSDSYIKP